MTAVSEQEYNTVFKINKELVITEILSVIKRPDYPKAALL